MQAGTSGGAILRLTRCSLLFRSCACIRVLYIEKQTKIPRVMSAPAVCESCSTGYDYYPPTTALRSPPRPSTAGSTLFWAYKKKKKIVSIRTSKSEFDTTTGPYSGTFIIDTLPQYISKNISPMKISSRRNNIVYIMCSNTLKYNNYTVYGRRGMR